MSYWQHLGTGEVLAWFLLVEPLSTPLSLHVLWTRSSSQKLDEMCFHFYISLSFLPSLLPAPSAYPWFSAHVEVDKEQELCQIEQQVKVNCLIPDPYSTSSPSVFYLLARAYCFTWTIFFEHSEWIFFFILLTFTHFVSGTLKGSPCPNPSHCVGILKARKAEKHSFINYQSKALPPSSSVKQICFLFFFLLCFFPTIAIIMKAYDLYSVCSRHLSVLIALF